MGANIQAAIFHVFDLNLGTSECYHNLCDVIKGYIFKCSLPGFHTCFFLLSFHQSTYLFTSLSCAPFNPMNYLEPGKLIELSIFKQMQCKKKKKKGERRGMEWGVGRERETEREHHIPIRYQRWKDNRIETGKKEGERDREMKKEKEGERKKKSKSKLTCH